MAIKKQGLYLYVRGLFFAMLCILLHSCVQDNRSSVAQDTISSKKEYVYGDEVPCPPDIISYPKENNKLLEKILDIYIDKEGINSKDDFLSLSSSCWTDSTFLIFFDHYSWNNEIDSIIPKDYGKISSYRGIPIYINFVGTSQFPIPNKLLIKNKEVHERSKSIIYPYNEYFNDIQIDYYPKENRVLDVFGNNQNVDMYRKIFREKKLLE